MVRLVFRPYTQVWRSICTSESLRTSIRVSPDFALLKHSSPSFGYQRVRSCSASQTTLLRRAGSAPTPRGRILPRPAGGCLHFHYAFRFRTTPWLAHMLDSLVRVSRRVGWRTDQFATDPRHQGLIQTVTRQRSRRTASSPPQSSKRAGPEAHRHGERPRSRSRSAPKGCNSVPEGSGTFPTSIWLRAEPVVALGPEKVHPNCQAGVVCGPRRILTLHSRRSASGWIPRVDTADPPVWLYTVSRTLELSLQSSFQLSLTVLVRYRTRACI